MPDDNKTTPAPNTDGWGNKLVMVFADAAPMTNSLWVLYPDAHHWFQL